MNSSPKDRIQLFISLGKLVVSFCTLVVVAMTAWIGVEQYRETKHKERLLNDFQMRRDFIMQPKLSDIQAKIEHESADLERILKKLVSAKNPYDPNLLNDKEKELHQKLDNYINFLEAVGSLRSRGWLERKDYSGFWNYYFRRLRERETLWKYISKSYYDWKDVTNWALEAHDEHKTRVR